MSAILYGFSIACIVAGAFFFAAGTVGLLRFPDAMTRLHALTKADNLGLGLVVLGILPHVGSVTGGIKLVLVWLLVLFSSAVVSQLIARVARAPTLAKTPGSLPPEGAQPVPRGGPSGPTEASPK